MGRTAEPAQTVAVVPPWDLACPDWEDRLRDGRSLVPDLPLDLAEGNRAVGIFDRLRLADVPGTPTMGEACGDWFRDIVRALFGSQDPATRQRMIRELFLLVPKKNSKTTNGALLMLTALLMNQRPKAPFLMTAPVHDVADMAFDAVAGAIALDPVLSKLLQVRDHLKTIVHRRTKAELQIMTFDPAVLTGQKVVGALIDELHVVAKMAKAPSALRQIRGGMLPFPEAFLAFITTQSEEAPAGVFKAELDTAREIRDGERVGAMLPVLYEFPKEMQAQPHVWRDPANWHLVTPNAGRSITIPRLVGEMAEAEAKGEAELRAWASQHLDVEVGLALMSTAWVGAKFWKPQDPLSLQELLGRSEVVEIGIDGGGLDDMLGLAVMGREPGTGAWLLWTHSWLHPIALERRKSEVQTYRDFQAAGELTIVEKIGDDVQQLVDFVMQVELSGLLDRIGVDRAGIASIRQAIIAAGIADERIVGIPQGWQLSGTIQAVERKLAEDQLQHGDSSLMSWAVGNAKVEPRGNAILITKQAAGAAKIDPLLAAFDAAALLSQNPEAMTSINDFLRNPVHA